MAGTATAHGRVIFVAPCCGQESWLAIARSETVGVLASASGETREAAMDLLRERLASSHPSFNPDEQPVWNL